MQRLMGKKRPQPVFTDAYFLDKAKQMAALGADMITIKDMSGLIPPRRVATLVKLFKKNISIPVDFHTHCTPGYGLASMLAAIVAGVDIVDTNCWYFSGGTGAPAIELIYVFCKKLGIDTGVNMEAVAKINKQVTIPGFRKGKAPRRVLEMHVGKDAIKEEAFEIAANSEYRETLKENKWVPVSDPEIKDSKFEEGQPMEMTLVVTLRPEPELGQYKDLDVAKDEKEITDADVDKEVENLQKRASKMVEAPEGKALEKGDLAIIDFAGTIDGEAFEGGEGKGYPLEVGSGSFIPGFEDQLVGLKKGESTDVNVTFPEDYFSKELAGKKAVFKVNVQDVKVKEVPEVTDELIAANSDSKTVAEFREKTMDRLKKAEAQRAQSDYETNLIKRLWKTPSLKCRM